MPSSTTLITIMLLFFFLANIDAKAVFCTDRFMKLIDRRNMTHCKTLRPLEAEFGWSYDNSENSSTTLEILFGAVLDPRQGWMAWGVNPGKRAEMIGTKAIIGIRFHDYVTATTTLKVDTYDITKETKAGCSLFPKKDIGINVSHKLIQDEGSNFYTIYAKLVLPFDEYNITRLNHVWQIGNDVSDDGRPLKHPTTLHNVDSTETIDLTSPHGRSMGQDRGFLRTMLAFRLKPKPTDDYRKYWNMYHHFLGYGLLTIIFINIFKGISILHGGESWKWSYIGILICLGAIAFALEIFTWIKFIMSKWRNNHHNHHHDKKTNQPNVSVQNQKE